MSSLVATHKRLIHLDPSYAAIVVDLKKGSPPKDDACGETQASHLAGSILRFCLSPFLGYRKSAASKNDEVGQISYLGGVTPAPPLDLLRHPP